MCLYDLLSITDAIIPLKIQFSNRTQFDLSHQTIKNEYKHYYAFVY